MKLSSCKPLLSINPISDQTETIQTNTVLACWKTIDELLCTQDLNNVLDMLLNMHKSERMDDPIWISTSHSLNVLVNHGLWPQRSVIVPDMMYLWIESIASIQSMSKKIATGNWGTNNAEPFREKFVEAMEILVWKIAELPIEMQVFFQKNTCVRDYPDFLLLIDEELFPEAFWSVLMTSWKHPLLHDILKIILQIIVCNETKR